MTLNSWQDWPTRLAARRWGGLGVSALAGALAAFGQAPFDVMPATLIGLAFGLAVVSAAETVRRAMALGWALGLGYFAVTLNWIVEPFLVEPEVFGWMAPFALVFMAGGMALFWGGAAGLGARLGRGAWRWVAIAAALGLAEWLRGWVFTGFPWGGPGLAWIDTAPSQLAAWIGVYGLNAVMFFLAGGLWCALRGVRPVAVWLGALAVVWGAGAALETRSVPERVGDQITLRLIQPNAAQAVKWDPEWVWTFFDRALTLTQAPAQGPAPDLVVWPETSIPALLGEGMLIEGEVARAAAPAPVVAGIQRREGFGYANSMVLFDGTESPVWTYDKHHLVPFGEYMPLAGLMNRFGLRGLAEINGAGFVEGPGAVVEPLPGALGNVLPLICYEAVFPRDLRAAPARADWVLQITNDAWFGAFSGPQQHLVQARFRAIEFGLPVVRAANTGISAVIDVKGELTASLPLNEAGFLDATLPPSAPPSLYARTGDWPLVAFLVITLCAIALRSRRIVVDPT